MRKLLIHLLMLLTLMPGLACGPFMAHAAAPAPGIENCHGMNMAAAQGKSEPGSRFFFKDCLKIDLSGAAYIDLNTPDLAEKIFSLAWAITAPDYSFAQSASTPAKVRGPPPDWPDTNLTLPSILRTTQRLRI